MKPVTDPALVKLLSQRMNLDEAEVAALQRGDIATIASRRFGDDPALAPLLQYMAQGGADEPPDARPNEPTRSPRADAQPSRGRRADLERRMSRARRLVRRLHEDLRTAQLIVDHVARVFGACPLCFGDDERCPECGGDGGPGSTRPDEEALLAWAEPALARLGLAITPKDRARRPRRVHREPKPETRNQTQGERDELHG